MGPLLTERLLLEPLTLDEARAIVAGDRTGRVWAADYPFEGDRFVASVVCEAGEEHTGELRRGPLQVRLRATGEAVGGIGALYPPTDGEVELGYGFAPSARGQGLATEALRAMVGLDWGVEVHRLVALTDPGNVASQVVLARCGFEQAGTTETDSGHMLRWVRDQSSGPVR